MRVEFQTTEGLAGLRPKLPPVTIDLERLKDQERRSLESLVRQARFFELPAHVPTPRGGPDGRACRITVRKNDGQQHTISVGCCVPGPALQKLIDRLLQIEAAALRDRRARRRD